MKFAKRFLLFSALLALAVTVVAEAQSWQSNGVSTQSFEVASIRHDPNSCGGCAIRFDVGGPDRYAPTNITAKWLIELAYGIKDFQLSGGPSWVNSQGFDIDAKIDDLTASHIAHLPRDQQEKQKYLMLRSLLADRFNLKITQGTKYLPVYAIVRAKGGPKLTPAGRGSDGLTTPLPGTEFTIRSGVCTITAHAEPILQLASMLSTQLGRLVLDQTAVKGTYDFKLQFAVETGPGGALLPPAQRGTGTETAPSLFSAIQEQLGLRLKSTKAPVETIAIDHIEEPSAN